MDPLVCMCVCLYTCVATATQTQETTLLTYGSHQFRIVASILPGVSQGLLREKVSTKRDT